MDFFLTDLVFQISQQTLINVIVQQEASNRK